MSSLFHKVLPFGPYVACWDLLKPGKPTFVHGVLTLTQPAKTTQLLRPGKGFNGWGKKEKKNLKTIKHKPRLYLERGGCCIQSQTTYGMPRKCH